MVQTMRYARKEAETALAFFLPFAAADIFRSWLLHSQHRSSCEEAALFQKFHP